MSHLFPISERHVFWDVHLYRSSSKWRSLMNKLKDDFVIFVDDRTLDKIAEKKIIDEFIKFKTLPANSKKYNEAQKNAECYVTTLLKNLKKVERDVIYLKYWKDFSVTKISQKLSIPKDKILQILNRALRRLKDFFPDELI